jgi:prepilin-type N-terminal cleavage/methylation domain-containing protein
MGFIPEDPRREDEAGFTLIELLVVMGISLIVGAAALMAIQTSQTSTAKTSARQEAVQQAEVALARLTGETRQAVAARLWTPTFLDLKTRVRVNGAASTLRRVQYDCATGSACRRRDCGAVAATGTLLSLGQTCASGTWVGLVAGLDQVTFGAQLRGVTVAVPPAREAVNASPIFDLVTVTMRIRLDDRTSKRQSVKDLDPVEIRGGVKLENVIAP